MKTIFLFIAVFISLCAKGQQTVKYTVHTNPAALQQRMPAGGSEDAELRELLQLMMDERKPEDFSYSLRDTVLIMKRSSAPNTTYEYIPNTLRYRVRSSDKGRSVTEWFDLDHKKNPDWKVSYDVLPFPDSVRTIKGYRCHKIRISETKTVKGETDLRILELWVTDQINLPAYVVAGLYEKVVSECPLEVRVWSGNLSEPHTIMKITEIK
jgi:hypothetical protein